MVHVLSVRRRPGWMFWLGAVMVAIGCFFWSFSPEKVVPNTWEARWGISATNRGIPDNNPKKAPNPAFSKRIMAGEAIRDVAPEYPPQDFVFNPGVKEYNRFEGDKPATRDQLGYTASRLEARNLWRTRTGILIVLGLVLMIIDSFFTATVIRLDEERADPKLKDKPEPTAPYHTTPVVAPPAMEKTPAAKGDSDNQPVTPPKTSPTAPVTPRTVVTSTATNPNNGGTAVATEVRPAGAIKDAPTPESTSEVARSAGLQASFTLTLPNGDQTKGVLEASGTRLDNANKVSVFFDQDLRKPGSPLTGKLELS